jgi:replicative DNA helicase
MTALDVDSIAAEMDAIMAETGSGLVLPDYSRLRSGDSFVLDAPAQPPAVWGEGSRVLWAQGEPLILAGPPGVGKTTLTGQLVRGRLGLSTDLLGLPVAADDRPVLYLAMDRPSQIARSLARQFTADERDVLAKRLVVWPGPPLADLGRHPGELLNIIAKTGAGTVFIDSLKDAAVKLTDDEVAGNVNRAMQEAVTYGCEVAALHHQRKRNQGGGAPKTLEDVYGSTWLTAGAGSVVLLWGAPGDPLVDLIHLKQPADEIGPLKIEHHLDGTTTVYSGFDPIAFLRNRPNGATATEAGRAMFERDPDDNERKKAKRLFDRLVNEGLAYREDGTKGGAGGSTAARYHLIGGGS